MKYDAVIVASGKGERARLGYNKVFYRMKDGRRVIDRSIELFGQDKDCERIIVVTNEDNFNEFDNTEKLILVKGGKERKDSVRNGLDEAKAPYVLVHDGARPFLNVETLQEIKKSVEINKAVVSGRMAVDTIKFVEDGRIIKTIDRNKIFMAETPQAFDTALLKECYERCADIVFTDDASLVESLGHEVYIVIDKYDNRKLTGEKDFADL